MDAIGRMFDMIGRTLAAMREPVEGATRATVESDGSIVARDAEGTIIAIHVKELS